MCEHVSVKIGLAAGNFLAYIYFFYEFSIKDKHPNLLLDASVYYDFFNFVTILNLAE